MKKISQKILKIANHANNILFDIDLELLSRQLVYSAICGYDINICKKYIKLKDFLFDSKNKDEVKVFFKNIESIYKRISQNLSREQQKKLIEEYPNIKSFYEEFGNNKNEEINKMLFDVSKQLDSINNLVS